jgi:hypothetical protein
MATKQFMEFRLEDGGSVIVEGIDTSSTPVTRGGGVSEKIVESGKTFDEVLQGLKPIASAIQKSLVEINNPDEITVEFGVKIGGKTGIILASLETEVNFQISIKWSNKA